MIPAPKILGDCKVVVYSPIDARHRPTGGCRHIVAGVVQGPAAGLAICEPKPDQGAFLFGCDGSWNVQTDSWFDSVEDAMLQAEFEYTGVRRTWLDHNPAWEPLSTSEENTVWKLFEEQFSFRPSTKPEHWPGIQEPKPSITFDISHVFSAPTAGDFLAEGNTEFMSLFRHCVLPGERLYALDWQHPGYRFNPYGSFEFSPLDNGMIPVVPDGDYYIFLADDFRFGTFGHPWEQTICVWGKKLLEVVERERPKLLGREVRRQE